MKAGYTYQGRFPRKCKSKLFQDMCTDVLCDYKVTAVLVRVNRDGMEGEAWPLAPCERSLKIVSCSAERPAESCCNPGTGCPFALQP